MNANEYYFPPQEDQLTQKEVAKLFGRTVQTINNWRKQNKIPYFEIPGGNPIYSKKQLVQFASKNQHLINEKAQDL